VHTSSGDKGGIWEADASPEAYDGFSQLWKKMSKHLLTLYLEEICKSDAQSLQLNWAGATLIDGDYSNPTLRPLGRTALKYFSLQVLA
jgi:curli production assembly/transport component CsgG